MNSEREISNLKQEFSRLNLAFINLDKRHAEAKNFTAKFLNICKDHGIKAVCIGVSHAIVPASVDFPFGSYGSIFAEGDYPIKNGSPAVWRVCEIAGVAGGCGNSDQHSADLSQLLEGAYQYRRGAWKKIDK